jgi:signal transduction histidine kinase
LSIAELAANSDRNPQGYTEEIFFSHKGSPKASLIGSIVTDLTAGSLYTIASLELNDIVAPVRSGVLILSLCILILLLGIFLISRNALYAGRKNEEARKEILLLKEKSRTLEEIHRKEQEISHNLRLQELGAVTSGIAHKFNNLLTPIMGYSSMLLETLPPEEDSNEKRKLRYIPRPKGPRIL